MFEHLNQALGQESSTEAEETVIDDLDESIYDCFLMAEEGSRLPEAIVSIQAMESELGDLEAIGAVVEKHGNSKSLISYVNRNRGLENLLKVPATEMAEMDAESINKAIEDVVKAYEDNNVIDDAVLFTPSTLHALFNKSDDEESALEISMSSVPKSNWAAAFKQSKWPVKGFWNNITGFFKNTSALSAIKKHPVAAGVVAGIALIVGIGTVLIKRHSKLANRVARYNKRIEGKTWDNEKAKTQTMFAPKASDFMSELGLINEVSKIVKVVCDSNLPTDESSYKSWTSKVDRALSKFKQSFGIEVDDWDAKRPSVSKAKMNLDMKDLPPSNLGYNGSSFGKIDTELKKVVEGIYDNIDDSLKDLKKKAEDISKEGKDGIYYGDRAIRTGIRIVSVVLSCVGSEVVPKAVGVLGSLSRYYTEPASE